MIGLKLPGTLKPQRETSSDGSHYCADISRLYRIYADPWEVSFSAAGMLQRVDGAGDELAGALLEECG